ncbi:MAG TPA: YajQ family cyclic di-GMP-binding protein [Terriglobales bacterium]|nr:YajQ family cyclic di-GMP-binding protein [Terriglobales bacterium]
MAANENSFDVASEVNLQEVANALQQALKEVTTRYDLKGSHTIIELDAKQATIALATADDYKLKAVTEILQQKLFKRGVSLRALSYGAVEPAAGGTVRQTVTLQNGISSEKARAIVQLIKESKKKVQASIQGEVVRVAGKDRDTLQEVMALLRAHDFGIDLQFTNYRSQ